MEGLLDRLRAEGYELDVRNPVVNAAATTALLKRKGMVRFYLPSGILGQRRKLAEMCRRCGISPVYEDETEAG